MRGRRQAHNPTLAKIMRLTYNRSCSHNQPQTAACNAVYLISRRALLITRLGEQLPRPRQVSMPVFGPACVLIGSWYRCSCGKRGEERRGEKKFGRNLGKHSWGPDLVWTDTSPLLLVCWEGNPPPPPPFPPQFLSFPEERGEGKGRGKKSDSWKVVRTKSFRWLESLGPQLFQ